MGTRRGASSVFICWMIISVVLLACKKKSATDGAPQPAPTQSFGLGQHAQLDGVTATVEQLKECRVGDRFGRDSLARRKEIIMGVNVAFEGNATAPGNFSHTDFKLWDSAGLRFRSTLRSDSECSPLLESGTLAKGERRRGWVLFQVPDGSSGFKIVLTHRRWGSEHQQSVAFEPAN